VFQRRQIELVAGDVDIDRRVIPLAASQKTRAHNTDHIVETSMRYCDSIMSCYFLSSFVPLLLIRAYSFLRRRGSQGSTYELVDSEAQWREIQERQGQKQQMQTATAILPAAFSSPAQMQQQGVPQQATVRKASASLTSPSSNSSLLDQSNGELMMSTETASQASSRHRQHRKHHHRHSHKHR